MNISEPFVTESRSHAKKLSPKVLKLKDFPRGKAFFSEEKVKKKKKDYDLNDMLCLCVFRGAV